MNYPTANPTNNPTNGTVTPTIDTATVVATSMKALEQSIAKYDIYVDTSCFMEAAVDKFYQHAAPVLRRCNKKLRIPSKVVSELRGHMNATEETEEKKEKKVKAQRGVQILLKMKADGIVEICEGANDVFCDNIFLTVISNKRMNAPQLLLTQDSALALDVLNLGNQHSVRSHEVTARRVNQFGFLSKFSYPELANKFAPLTPQPPKKTFPSHFVPESEKFRVATEVVADTNVTLDITGDVPTLGDVVYTASGEEIILQEYIAEGGEGTVYKATDNLAVKIYKQNKLTSGRKEKLELMISKPVKCAGITWPIELVYNDYDEFVGFTMPLAKGHTLADVVRSKQNFLTYFPNWTKADLANCAYHILYKIQVLHARNVMLGDVNLRNILIEAPDKIHLIDMDSIQVEGYACPVETEGFKAPELFLEDELFELEHGRVRQAGEYLKTPESERYAVAVLLFELFIGGKHPLSRKGGASIKQNIMDQDFAYPLGENHAKDVPDGYWRFMWSSLFHCVKRKFFGTFAKGGEFNEPEKRLTVKQWMGLMKYYRDKLWEIEESGTYSTELEIFPTWFKISSKVAYVPCCECGEKYPVTLLKNGICVDCLAEEEDAYESEDEDIDEDSDCDEYEEDDDYDEDYDYVEDDDYDEDGTCVEVGNCTNSASAPVVTRTTHTNPSEEFATEIIKMLCEEIKKRIIA